MGKMRRPADAIDSRRRRRREERPTEPPRRDKQHLLDPPGFGMYISMFANIPFELNLINCAATSTFYCVCFVFVIAFCMAMK